MTTKPTYEELKIENENLKMQLSEKKDIEMELAYSKILMQAAFEQSPVPMAVITYPDFSFKIINAAAEELLLIKAADYVGKKVEEINISWKDTSPDGRLFAINELPMPLALSGVTTKNMEIVVVRHDGTKRWELCCGAPIYGQDSELIAGIIVMHDITERKQTELFIQQTNEQLKIAKEKAEESDRLKTAFLANISHEIRTPMNGILGFSELLKEPGLNSSKQQEYIRIIEKSGARMLNILNDIVDISKIEAGLMKIELNKSNIIEQIEFICTFFKPEVDAKGIKLLFKNPLYEKEAIIITDREKLYAILTNLVKNAIKYTEEGEIELGYIKKGETLEFYIRDTGIGIPKDRQVAIFERFVQADFVDKMARQGAGLGLSITKAYVEMLGGKIRVESQEGIGSVFYFTLPYNAEPVIETVVRQLTHSNKTAQHRKLKILIADDDEVSEMFINLIVNVFGKEILKVRTGVEAVEICRENPDIDLILMDIRMPEMNGYEATRQIRQFNNDVVIIAQTAFAQKGDSEKSISAGCNDYISKPIDKDKLLALIQKYFSK